MKKCTTSAILLTINLVLLLLCACGKDSKAEVDLSSSAEDISMAAPITEDKGTQPNVTQSAVPQSTPVPEQKHIVKEGNKDCSHNYAAVVLAEASCTKTGTMQYTCSVCGDCYTLVIPMREHTAVRDKAAAATCTETGLTEGSHCGVCGYIIEAQKETPMRSHTKDKGSTVEATCTEDGCTTYKCSVCGEELEKVKIPATGHSYENGICTECGMLDPNYLPQRQRGENELPEDIW